MEHQELGSAARRVSFNEQQGGTVAALGVVYLGRVFFCGGPTELDEGVAAAGATWGPAISVGGPRLDWTLEVPTNTLAGQSELHLAASATPDMANPTLFAILPVQAAGTYSSSVANIGASWASGVAAAGFAGLMYRSPLPYFSIRFLNGGTVQAAGLSIYATGGGH